MKKTLNSAIFRGTAVTATLLLFSAVCFSCPQLRKIGGRDHERPLGLPEWLVRVRQSPEWIPEFLTTYRPLVLRWAKYYRKSATHLSMETLIKAGERGLGLAISETGSEDPAQCVARVTHLVRQQIAQELGDTSEGYGQLAFRKELRAAEEHIRLGIGMGMAVPDLILSIVTGRTLAHVSRYRHTNSFFIPIQQDGHGIRQLLVEPVEDWSIDSEPNASSEASRPKAPDGQPERLTVEQQVSSPTIAARRGRFAMSADLATQLVRQIKAAPALRKGLPVGRAAKAGYPHLDEESLARLLLQLRALPRANASIASLLNREGLPPPRPFETWTSEIVRQVVERYRTKILAPWASRSPLALAEQDHLMRAMLDAGFARPAILQTLQQLAPGHRWTESLLGRRLNGAQRLRERSGPEERNERLATLILSLRRKGFRRAKIASSLTADAIPPPDGEPEWNAEVVDRVVGEVAEAIWKKWQAHDLTVPGFQAEVVYELLERGFSENHVVAMANERLRNTPGFRNWSHRKVLSRYRAKLNPEVTPAGEVIPYSWRPRFDAVAEAEILSELARTPDPDTAVLDAVTQLRWHGLSGSAVAKFLNAQSVPVRSGPGGWTAGRVETAVRAARRRTIAALGATDLGSPQQLEAMIRHWDRRCFHPDETVALLQFLGFRQANGLPWDLPGVVQVLRKRPALR